MKLKIQIIFWRILKQSIVFRYWYKKHLTELMFDLEIFDINKKEIIEKYNSQLVRFK